MSTATTIMTANEAIESLQAKGLPLSASRRRGAVNSLRDALGEGFYEDSTIQAIYRLASDPDRGVRQDVASLIHLLPQEDFQRLFDDLRNDRNAFVRDAAQNALKRREKERRNAARRKKEVRWIQAHSESLENRFGKRATKKIIDVTARRCGLMMGSVIHNISETMSQVRTQLYRATNEIGGNQAAIRVALEKMERHLLFLDQHFYDMAIYARPGRLRYQQEPLADVIRESITKVRESLQEKGRERPDVAIDVHVPGRTTVEMSRHWIVTALVNVIKNAVEAYPVTNSGRVEIHARSVSRDIEIVVEDRGAGIYEEDLEEIRQFLLGRTTKKNHGTGFGLPIAEQFIAIHGGSVKIDSEEGKGTTVTIRLPKRQP